MGQTQRAQQMLNSAVSQFQDGKLDAAAESCNSVLASLPNEPNALHILGAVRLRQNDPENALKILQTAQKSAPKNPEILANLGAAYRGCGQPGKAIDVLRKAIRLNAKNPSAHLNLGNAYAAAEQPDKAVSAYRKVLKLVPDHIGARRTLAETLRGLGSGEEALAEFMLLDRKEPDNPETLNAIGALHADAGDLEKAESLFREALARDPGNTDITTNLGNVLAMNFELDEALNLYRSALAAAPDTPDLLCNMGNALSRGGQNAEASTCYRNALRLDPDHVDAHASIANNLLAGGAYGEGWRHFLNRTSTRAIAQRLHREPFDRDLTDRTISVMADQGLGDQIFFARYLSVLTERGARVAYRPDGRLAEMLTRSGIADDIVGESTPLDGDIIVSAGDLPYLLAKDGDAILPPAFDIPANPGNVATLQDKLSAFGPPPYIGVTWRAGTPNLRRALSKEAPLDGFAQTLSGTSATIVVVQRNIRESEAEQFESVLGRPVLDLSATNDDIEDLLALAGLLDTYVGVSNTVTHLRAASHQQSHVFVPIPAEFRWMNAGETSPWFPDCRVYRQSPDGSWQDAFNHLSDDLGT